MPTQQLIISESEVYSAVIDYLKKSGITVSGTLHPKITYTRIGRAKQHHFGGYYIQPGEYQKE